ncbi:MAG: hypothetical protein L6Q71_11085 [Planctomycetes bacterium]|nr:hypothetical protein [Planctomycetota bacterium]
MSGQTGKLLLPVKVPGTLERWVVYSEERALLVRIVLTIIILVAVEAALGAAATLAVGLLILIVSHGRLMVWEAEYRNNTEKAEFESVNKGEKEPDPHFLERVWGA